MKALIIIILKIAIIQAGVIKEDEKNPCPGVKIDGVYLEPEILKTDLDRPYQLAVDYSTNIIYFSYSINEKDDGFKSAYVNLNTKEFADLPGVYEGFTHAVDQKNNEIYIGGGDGIYKYNYNSKPELIAEKGKSIWNMFFKDVLYYTDFPSQFLNTYANGEITRFKDLANTKVDQFVIDNEDILYFTNNTGLYSQKKDSENTTVLIKEFTNGSARQLATDVKGNVYACMSDGIYKINKEKTSVDKILDVDDAFGVAFDNANNIVYSDDSKLIRLKPNKEKAC